MRLPFPPLEQDGNLESITFYLKSERKEHILHPGIDIKYLFGGVWVCIFLPNYKEIINQKTNSNSAIV